MTASLLLAVLLAAPADGARPKMAVLELAHAADVDPQVAAALTDAVTSEVAARGLFDVVSAREIQTLLGVERERQLLGCSEEAASCYAELAGALGAQLVVTGTLARLGSAWQLSLQTVDTVKGRTVGRATRMAKDASELRAQLPWTVAEATASPLPPPPSRAVPFALLGAGTASVIAGAVFTVGAYSRESVLRQELRFADEGAGALRPLPQYELEARQIERQRLGGFAGLGVGAALVTAGVLLDRRATFRPAGIALVPTAGGAALAGHLPW